ncbi:uncharacterized protein LOC132945082 [Metopolophium dirhodum]|uniref:uncharacterized protein LOC132945082 n=1 Tax=Metopolophium dirhodum TaxID=44670 RepID=UPI00298FDA84|nr:uncharacterized protein LOC132945082 [Metopolophium dirhodum]XP_060870690.1 uncharacterized protein LOC132945082 [Metopolophium dirhodum]
MYSTAFTAVCLVICSCLLPTIYAKKINRSVRNEDDCSLWVAEKVEPKMPIPFTSNGKRYAIIYPNAKGRLDVKKGRSFKLSCATAKFASSELQRNGTSDALVTCVGSDVLEYRGRTYRYEDFQCDGMPKSELRVTDDRCQPANYTVAVVGFQTDRAFLRLYGMCFDKSTKNSLYTWYDARAPYYDNHQKYSKRPAFIKSKELYGNTDVNRKYTFKEQKKTVAKILRSDELADKYIRNDNQHSLSRGHYAAKADFFFDYEQTSTFYYANVAPQWQIFNGDMWADLEQSTRTKLSRKNGTSTQVIVTGTYDTCTLADVDDVQQPLYLDLPGAIRVPLFYWKLHYDVDAADGIVYIGLNNPYKEIDDSVYICPNICPDGYHGRGYQGRDHRNNKTETEPGRGDRNDPEPDANDGLIYCCTKKSFEEAYGELDPIVYKQLM